MGEQMLPPTNGTEQRLDALLEELRQVRAVLVSLSAQLGAQVPPSRKGRG